jgi:hypothetical protein
MLPGRFCFRPRVSKPLLNCPFDPWCEIAPGAMRRVRCWLKVSPQDNPIETTAHPVFGSGHRRILFVRGKIFWSEGGKSGSKHGTIPRCRALAVWDRICALRPLKRACSERIDLRPFLIDVGTGVLLRMWSVLCRTR